MNKCPELVILIHGTFAAAEEDCGDRWWQEGSRFRSTLVLQGGDSIAVEFEPFRWSGANSERARRNAATSLVDRLRNLEAAGKPYHIIAHSHGGSVVWLAFRTLAQSRQTLPRLRSWATLGTPFIRYEASPLGPFTVVSLLLFVVALTFPSDRAWSSPIPFVGIVRTVFDLWNASPHLLLENQYFNLLALPFLALLAVLLGAYLVYTLCASLSQIVSAKRDSERDQAASQLYGNRYLGIWSPSDEAINGIRASVRLQGAITPRWLPSATSLRSSLISGAAWPARTIYNYMAAPLADSFICTQISKRMQGNDIAAASVVAVSSSPSQYLEDGQCPLGEIDKILVASANESAARSVKSVRNVLGLSADVDTHTLVTTFTKELTFRELVHTSYYENAQVVAMLRSHLKSNFLNNRAEPSEKQLASLAGRRPASFAQMGGWKDPVRLMSYVKSAAILLTLLSLWASISILFFNSIKPYLPEFQIDTMLESTSSYLPSARTYREDGLRTWIFSVAATQEPDRVTHYAGSVRHAATKAMAHAYATLGFTAVNEWRHARDAAVFAMDLADTANDERHRNPPPGPGDMWPGGELVVFESDELADLALALTVAADASLDHGDHTTGCALAKRAWVFGTRISGPLTVPIERNLIHQRLATAQAQCEPAAVFTEGASSEQLAGALQGLLRSKNSAELDRRLKPMYMRPPTGSVELLQVLIETGRLSLQGGHARAPRVNDLIVAIIDNATRSEGGGGKWQASELWIPAVGPYLAANGRVAEILALARAHGPKAVANLASALAHAGRTDDAAVAAAEAVQLARQIIDGRDHERYSRMSPIVLSEETEAASAAAQALVAVNKLTDAHVYATLALKRADENRQPYIGDIPYTRAQNVAALLALAYVHSDNPTAALRLVDRIRRQHDRDSAFALIAKALALRRQFELAFEAANKVTVPSEMAWAYAGVALSAGVNSEHAILRRASELAEGVLATEVAGASGRDRVFVRLAEAWALIGAFRIARLTAERCWSANDRLLGYSKILLSPHARRLERPKLSRPSPVYAQAGWNIEGGLQSSVDHLKSILMRAED